MTVIVLVADRGDAVREAIPLRALPQIGNWEMMGPTEVVEALAGKSFRHQLDEPANRPTLQAHWLRQGRVSPIKRREWGNNWGGKIRDLAKGLKARAESGEITHEMRYELFKRGSTGLLPASAFVWKDEFELYYSMTYEGDSTPSMMEDGVWLSLEEQEEATALDFDPFIPDAELWLMMMEGFEGYEADADPAAAPTSQARSASATGASEKAVTSTGQAGSSGAGDRRRTTAASAPVELQEQGATEARRKRGGTELIWTPERIEEARAIQANLKGQNNRAYTKLTAERFGVSVTWLRLKLNGKPKKPKKVSKASPWPSL